MVEKITSENFEAEVLHAEKAVMVDFYADWCTPCKMLAPTIAELAEGYAGKIKVGKLDIDQNMDLADRYGVMNIPTLVIFKDGKEKERIMGLQPKEAVEDFIKRAL